MAVGIPVFFVVEEPASPFGEVAQDLRAFHQRSNLGSSTVACWNSEVSFALKWANKE